MHANAVSTAFDDLFTTEYPRVTAIARRFVGPDAEDVAQEVFAAFSRAAITDPVHARAWLHRAALHRSYSSLRAAQRRDAREHRVAALEPREPAKAGDPQDALERHERGTALRSALASLPERYASVLALRAAGLSYKELALAFGVTTNAIGTLLIRAEAALRKELSREPSFR